MSPGSLVQPPGHRPGGRPAGRASGARGRPLGASRVLWEIADDSADVRALRARLGLESGYLSLLLRSLECERLVTVGADRAEKRVRTVRLTAAGRAERALLDRSSDELARSLLEPLGARQRSRLVAAMGVVERLLTAGLVEVAVEDPRGVAGRFCLESYYAELNTQFDTGFDPERAISTTAEELTGDQQGVARGRQPLPLRWLRRGRSLQRRAVRSPLVCEAAVALGRWR